MLYINDKIHGSIEISNLAQSIIDTPEFQRLRRISQVGVVKWIFPSATHTRFEHSIGVYHLAKTFSKNLLWDKTLAQKSRLIELIGIAGLVHDLGHLAFSHLFESYLLSQGINFHHEELSQNLFRTICIKYKINLTNEDIDLIINLIHPPQNWKDGRIWQGIQIGKWIYQIISNPSTGIDVDKFDYIIRDSVYCGVTVSFNFDRIIKMSQIIDNEIIYPWKIRFNIFEMYLSRYEMHRQIYHHKTVMSLEILISQILKHLNQTYDFKTMINNYNILELTDDIIYKYDNIDISNLLYRIDTRQFPKSCSKETAIYTISLTNSLSSNQQNPLTYIKYFNKNKAIIYANIEDYGILASHDYKQKCIFYFTK
ncbi:putative HD superfamily phosphohydrolase [Cafeteria roenbergensis virus]|uniref:Putative HD superfamily phosphohydrolase n=1 Tax=Cafeteria roenbergensis virus (strain BV-PW1) TaxID=693272 RepID=E3T4P8_CROVB|nr:putative HD superfamily phosphohydrolase [Cafeteria roenbergensis virus BV-PW1]ADO67161.1 putative HD superfamily phosphohydrolase [Cafeteria roenbergensis virus BV-PW1]